MYGKPETADAAGDSEKSVFRRAEKKYKLYNVRNPKLRSVNSLTLDSAELSSGLISLRKLRCMSLFRKSFIAGRSRRMRRRICRTFLISNPLWNPSDRMDQHQLESSSTIAVASTAQSSVSEIAPRSCIAYSPDEFLTTVLLLQKFGFYFIPGALAIEEQVYWFRESLTNFPQPPNRTNHSAIYGPIFDLFNAVQNHKVLVEEVKTSSEAETIVDHEKNKLGSRRYLFSDSMNITNNSTLCKSVAAYNLLRKLRWSTLGLQFDWSKRNYDVSLPHQKIPYALCLVAKKMAVPAMPKGVEFQPDAAIVNYFGPRGNSRDDVPVAMFLRSGDIVLMAGEARECFHGVPRIFTDSAHADNGAFLSELSDEADYCFREYIKTSRVNINIRQVN
ncbi:Alpha-ketoglutarate-dependent dioxygenase alkB [Apostasia shenzhenica]|uniref:Alpha-ketoglutarate-dependent dioxygenase alkB n=1 Tax=Apostasia shenzhenica TaxID=1088818 RepID=A0A2I0AIY8_9ASPA|nr:Alpha-ketoglutarate-dependent dioxygenase alkB [Apostasia shenzhenica]